MPENILRIIPIASLAELFDSSIGMGYGPELTGGQVLSGVSSRFAVAVASIAEGITSATGFTRYLLNRMPLQMNLAFAFLIGAVISVPFSAYIVREISTEKMIVIIGCVATVLGSYTLLKVVM